ncbi:nitroreductase family protein [Streptomyces sp. DH12]|uniref:Acg family FMN-binding oxidoreductase n=1 Tax=Streptomyces sp. DH12 TaxID=2857010 RepID=UPI001E502F0A|nr:nitroreductase family protein [Streptomyces sp. DH12]
MPVPAPDASALTSWVADAVTAPSMHNAQPWSFRYERARGVLTLRPDPARTMPNADPSTRGLHIGCGAALFNLRVAAAHAGWAARIRLLPEDTDPGTPAVITFVPGDEEEGVAGLHPAIGRRRTNREPFGDEAVPQALLDGLRGAARAEGARLEFPDDWQVQQLLDLAWEAEYLEKLSPAVREEVARWASEGIPPSALGPRRHESRGPVRDLAGGRRIEGRAAAVFERSPCLAVLGTRGDAREDWLRAGQAMERVLLQATLDGLAASLNSQALEWRELRWLLRDPLSETGHPQMLIRLGYGPDVPPTARRPVSDVLTIV